jgi:hypothetical protein
MGGSIVMDLRIHSTGGTLRNSQPFDQRSICSSVLRREQHKRHGLVPAAPADRDHNRRVNGLSPPRNIAWHADVY